MVNYVRMEEVWRSYGPMEPIGPGAKPKRRVSPIVLGILAVCVVGAGAGLWLRTGGSPEPQRTSPAPTVASGGDRDRALAEAAELQEALRVAVTDETTPPPASPIFPPPASVPEGPIGASPLGPPLPLPSTAPVGRAPTSNSTSAVHRVPTPSPAPVEVRVFTPPDAPVVASAPTPSGQAPNDAARTPPGAAPVVEGSPGPSFECSYARTAAERLVCDRPDLAALDRRLAAELEGAVAAGHNPAELQRDQADWRRRREAAAPDPRAVADSYQRRIGQLRSMQ